MGEGKRVVFVHRGAGSFNLVLLRRPPVEGGRQTIFQVSVAAGFQTALSKLDKSVKQKVRHNYSPGTRLSFKPALGAHPLSFKPALGAHPFSYGPPRLQRIHRATVPPLLAVWSQTPTVTTGTPR
jgi:hypothetical protein